jgi:hypothetical protein
VPPITVSIEVDRSVEEVFAWPTYPAGARGFSAFTIAPCSPSAAS